MQKNVSTLCKKKVLSMFKCIKSDLQSFIPEVSFKTMFHCQVETLNKKELIQLKKVHI